jgi:hypothetical protein
MVLQATGPKQETFVYQPVETLQSMTAADLAHLWELVPTERQKYYKTVYDGERRRRGVVGSDKLELEMVTDLLNQYTTAALVPVGTYWVKAPPRLRNIAQTNAELVAPETLDTARSGRRPLALVFGGGLVLCAVILLLILARSGQRTGKAALQLSSTPSLTPTVTPVHSPTPTPLALEGQDAIIRGSDSSSSGIYPVNLRVLLADGTVPRVFVVQRRVVQMAEWSFNADPDTASYLAGLVVRPVIGIPWSADNRVFFEQMAQGTEFVVQMNSGAALRFAFASRATMNRSDTQVFRQTEPGLVLVLIGERDETSGELTASRIVVHASYLPDQELAGGLLAGLDLPPVDTPTPTLSPTPFQRVDVQIIAVESTPDQAIITLRIYNGGAMPFQIDGQSIWLASGYVAYPSGPRVYADITPFGLLPGQAADLTLHFRRDGEPYATLGVLSDYQFAIDFVER